MPYTTMLQQKELRDAATARGWLQPEVAARSGVPRQSVGKLFTGVGALSLATYNKVRSALGLEALADWVGLKVSRPQSKAKPQSKADCDDAIVRMLCDDSWDLQRHLKRSAKAKDPDDHAAHRAGRVTQTEMRRSL